MKKILYIIIACAFALISCSDELGTQQEIPADTIVLKVFNSPMTKAEFRDGDGYERQLNRLDIFFYPEGTTDQPCVYYVKQDVVEEGEPDGEEEIKLNVTESEINDIFGSSSKCEVLVIANLPEYITEDLPDGKYVAGAAGTDVNTLSGILLTLGGEHDAVGQPFVMAGHHTAEKGENNNASGMIPLYRAASKITLTVTIPEEIEAADGVVMVPVLKALNADNELESTLKAAFHNGVTKTYLYVGEDDESVVVGEDYFSTQKVGFTQTSTIPAEGTTPAKSVYTCDVPFYTYARSWEKGSPDAAYLTMELMWVAEDEKDNSSSYKSYYYQVLVNGAGRCFEPNHWYDLTVNVGVLGSTVEFDPKTINDLTYYVLDWTTEPESGEETGDRYEEVDIQEYVYFVVPETYIELYNVTTGQIKYSASHKIGIRMNTASKPIRVVDGTTNLSSYYINCDLMEPNVAELPRPITTANNFKIEIDDEGKQTGIITYTYRIPQKEEDPVKIYSPVFVYAQVWLDIDGEGDLDTGTVEEEFVEFIEIVQYPPMYVIPDESTVRSVHINNQTGDKAITIGNYPLGKATGTNSTTGYTNTAYMFDITVSSFQSTDEFYIGDDSYKYIIGDPRNHQNNTDLNNDGVKIAKGSDSGWRNDSQGNTLDYYYPTLTNADDPNAFRVISPKFKVASMFGGYSSACTHEGAAMRCASYQEDGYPAGRWRLPTTAEVLFVIKLQTEESIQPLFYGGNYYYSSTHSIQCQTGIDISTPKTTGSVRCVYDVWFWGNDREAETNNAGTYQFTWGDKKIWDDNGNPL